MKRLSEKEEKRLLEGLNELSKDELVHLVESCLSSVVDALKRNREHQREREKEGPMLGCWDCKMIARKLGIE